MTKELIEKLKGHTDHIVGLYLLFAEKYALIDPMIFGKRVCRRFGSAEKGILSGKLSTTHVYRTWPIFALTSTIRRLAFASWFRS
jgi:hypothetical protein